MSSIFPRQFWPYETAPIEQLNDEQRKQIAFMQTAFESGFAPFNENYDLCFEASSANRNAIMIRRYRMRKVERFERVWELLLVEADDAADEKSNVFLRAFVIGFDAASQAALRWLRGQVGMQILTSIKEDIDLPRGYRLNGVKLHA